MSSLKMLRRIIFHKRCLVIYTKSGLKCLKLSALCPFSSSLLGVIIYVLNVHLCTAKLYGLEVAKEDLVWSANRLYSDFQGRIQGGGFWPSSTPLPLTGGAFGEKRGKTLKFTISVALFCYNFYWGCICLLKLMKNVV